jgi:hypothetical protein
VRPLALTLGLFALLTAAQNNPAAQPPIEVPERPYANLHAPPEAVSGVAGGPGIVLTDAVKSTVVMKRFPGGPCGGGTPYDSGMTNPLRSESQGQPASESGGIGLWLPVGSAVAGVAGLSLIGFWLLRRSRV